MKWLKSICVSFAMVIDEVMGICYYNSASRTCGEFDFRKKIAHNDCGSGEQSSSYLIRRGNVRKQIKLATKVVFVSLPENEEQTFF